jgi:hypothetical protein
MPPATLLDFRRRKARESSNFDAIQVGSKDIYADAAIDASGLDTDIVVEIPNGDTVNGPCGTRRQDPRHGDARGWFR